jgi:hypothetical protein
LKTEHEATQIQGFGGRYGCRSDTDAALVAHQRFTDQEELETESNRIRLQKECWLPINRAGDLACYTTIAAARPEEESCILLDFGSTVAIAPQRSSNFERKLSAVKYLQTTRIFPPGSLRSEKTHAIK